MIGSSGTSAQQIISRHHGQLETEHEKLKAVAAVYDSRHKHYGGIGHTALQWWTRVSKYVGTVQTKRHNNTSLRHDMLFCCCVTELCGLKVYSVGQVHL